MNYRVSGLLAAFFCCIFWAQYSASTAGFLTVMSDTLGSSAPSTSTNHSVIFRINTAVPGGGKVVFTPEAGSFTIPESLDYTDIDFATSSAEEGPYVHRSLAATAGVFVDGVSVATGTAGSFTITLGGANGLDAGTFLKINIGTIATFESAGDVEMFNPAATGSVHMYLRTETGGGAVIEEGITMVVILPEIELYADTLDFDPPVRSNGLPTSTLPAGITNVEISLNTNEPANCRYSTSSGVAYPAMTNNFATGFATFHTVVITGLQNGQSYTFNVRCADFIPNFNLDDYPISFSIGNPLPPPISGGGGGGGGGSGGGSGGQPFPAPLGMPQVIFSGKASPGATVHLLKDNVAYKTGDADGTGQFEITATDVGQGTYAFALYAIDSRGRRSSSYSTTITLVLGTRNTVATALIPPTISLAENTVAPGDTASILGRSAPSAQIEVIVTPQKKGVTDADVVRYSAVTDSRGDWQHSLNTRGMSGTYDIKARATIAPLGTSALSTPVLLGVGQSPAADTCVRSDINADRRVNLVDFSILLFNWNTTDPSSDINLDGRVNLVDFSVMLFCWTG